MGFLYEKTEKGISITGYEGAVRDLQAPRMIDGLPVRRIAPSAFADRGDIRSVRLPDTVEELGRSAFYMCRNLAAIFLPGSIRHFGDSVFRQCAKLAEAELTILTGHYDILKDLINDTEQSLHILIHMPDGDAALTFSDYLPTYQENTMARLVHFHIEGAGFAFRECVKRDGIDFREYDKLFDRIRYGDEKTAAQTALDRLMLPYRLSERAKEQYRQYLAEHAEYAVRFAVERGHAGYIAVLLENGLQDDSAVSAGMEYAASLGKPEIAAMLLAASPKKTERKRFIL